LHYPLQCIQPKKTQNWKAVLPDRCSLPMQKIPAKAPVPDVMIAQGKMRSSRPANLLFTRFSLCGKIEENVR